MATGGPPQTCSLECENPDCSLGKNGARWKSPEMEASLAMQLLVVHIENNHKQQPVQVVETKKSKAEKVSRPTIKMGSTEDDFIFFKCLFESYKRSCQLTDITDIRDQLLACCETDLRRDLHRYLGTGVDTKSEVELLTEIKRIAVITRSNLVNVVSLMSAAQEHGETCRSYLARVRGLANVCKLSVTCTAANCGEQVSYTDTFVKYALIKGLVDNEVREELLSQSPELNLEQSLAFIEAKEQGKRSHKALEGSVASGEVNKVTAYQQHKKEEQQTGDDIKLKPCKFCGRMGHGESPSLSVRREKCPAWNKECNKCHAKGHFKSRCHKDGVKVDLVKVLEKEMVCSVGMAKVVKKQKLHGKATVRGGLKGAHCPEIKEPIPHIRFGTEIMIGAPLPQPVLAVTLVVDTEFYGMMGLRVPSVEAVRSVSIRLTADSGAQVTACNVDKLPLLGLRRRDLLSTSVGLECANKEDANVLGVFIGKIVGKDDKENTISVQSLVYVMKHGGNLLSREVLKQLGVLPPEFPRIGQFSSGQAGKGRVDEVTVGGSENEETERQGGFQPPGQCDPQSQLPCQCPLRTNVEVPDKLPVAAVPENRKKLEDWILQYYSPGAFNVCKRQPMPSTAGPPLKIFVDPAATPVRCTKPIPVPLHFRDQVKKDLLADEQRGVIERVPLGVKPTWMAKMLIQPKKDGRPRRVVDMSALTKVARRELHHTRSPFKVACSVPGGVLKTTLDCVDGYHGVEIAEEDRDKMSFLTEWGAFRYRRVPQGFGPSGDGYTRRTDDILSATPDKPGMVDMEKIVDDILIWSEDMERAFFRVCNVLSHAGKHGMVFCPKKFNFAKEEVEFAGLMIGLDGIRPTEQYKQAILDFPVPRCISDARSWFGLINQVDYCFSKSLLMAPFRHLLKPSTKFEWTEELGACFEESKKKIIGLIEDGVRSFDPQLVTCLSPDWCQDGIGWILQQKTCTCDAITPICCPEGWRLVLAGGRFTLPAESRYSPTEGECLAVAVGLEQSKFYTLGCPKLYIATDHKPLVGILCDRALDTIANPRIVSIKERTLWWNFEILYVAGKSQQAADALSRKKFSAAASVCRLQMLGGDSGEDSGYFGSILSATLAALISDTEPRVITWEQLQQECRDDKTMVTLADQIRRGFPDSGYDVNPIIREFHRYRHGLCVVDGVPCYKTRIVIPDKLRSQILTGLHSAHQGVSGMTARAEQSVFWPSITRDIVETRASCRECHRIAPSQPAAPPVSPPSPEYPFQLQVCDYFSLHGRNYLALADRYSGWLTAYRVGSGEYDAKALVKILRQHFVTFGVAVELASDGGPQMVSGEVKKFLNKWGVRHRVSSSYYPHSNNRAETAVKTCKRLLMENMDSQGDLDTDTFGRAMLEYRNTPNPETRLSPAQVVFGRNVRDFIPVLPYKYEPRQEWSLLQEDRERAFARKLYNDGTKLAMGTRKMPPLSVGDKVLVQNQTGRAPNKWDKSGVIIECKPHNQVNVMMDGSRKVSLRNRQFVRKIDVPTPGVGSGIKPSQFYSAQHEVADVPGVQHHQDGGPGEVGQEECGQLPEVVDGNDAIGNDGGVVNDGLINCQDRVAVDDQDRGGADGAVVQPQVMRSKRTRKPNSKYDPEVYDLDAVGIRGIPLEGKKNGWRGIYWPE